MGILVAEKVGAMIIMVLDAEWYGMVRYSTVAWRIGVRYPSGIV